MRWVSTKGPFLVLLPIALAPLPLNDEFARPFVRTGLVAFGRQTPRAHRMATPLGFSFTAAVRMVDRIHRRTADARVATEPTDTTGFTDRHVFMVDVGKLADRGIAELQDLSDFSRRQSHRGVAVFARHQLSLTTGRSDNLPT